MFIEDNVYVFGCQFQFIIIIIIVIIVIILLCGHAVVRCIEMKVWLCKKMLINRSHVMYDHEQKQWGNDDAAIMNERIIYV